MTLVPQNTLPPHQRRDVWSWLLLLQSLQLKVPISKKKRLGSDIPTAKGVVAGGRLVEWTCPAELTRFLQRSTLRYPRFPECL